MACQKRPISCNGGFNDVIGTMSAERMYTMLLIESVYEVRMVTVFEHQSVL
jgi:hypothetical protein